jgi:tetratricopeptide (TPR) repeat protein
VKLPAPALAAIVGLALATAWASSSCASSRPAAIAREWYELGNAWADKGEWKKAGQAYSRAVRIDPAFAGASYNLARAFTEAGDYEEALRSLGALTKQDPKNVRLLSMRAFVLYKKGDTAEALKAYRAVLELDPYAPDAVFNAALLELDSGDAAAAVADLERLTLAKPDDGQAFLLLARASDKNDLPGQALSAYEKAKSLGKADAGAFERMGRLYEDGRRFADAMDAYDAAVKADAKRAAAWFALARLRLVVAADADQGLAALKGALDAGFSDKEAATALLDEPDLPEREKVYEALKAKDLAR